MMMRAVRFVGGAIAAGLAPPLVLGFDAWTGYLVMVAMVPVAFAAPLFTIGYAVEAARGWKTAHRIGAFLLLAGNIALAVTGMWGFVMTACWSCEWPYPIMKVLLVSNPIVAVGSVLAPRFRRARLLQDQSTRRSTDGN